MISYFTIMVLSYHVQGEYVQSRIVFPSAQACGDALPAYYEPVYAFDRDSMAQCEATGIASKSIRPKARPNF
jgi:hypothetical protein